MANKSMYGEETKLINFRVPKSKEAEIKMRIYGILNDYVVRGKEITVHTSVGFSGNFKSAEAGLYSKVSEVNTFVSDRAKKYFGGEIVRKDISECFLVDGFKSLYRDREFSDDYYVLDVADMVHYTDLDAARNFMKANWLK